MALVIQIVDGRRGLSKKRSKGSGSEMTILYKGVGVGTFLHKADLRATGLVAHMPALSCDTDTIIRHIRNGTTTTPCISLTRSYGVAEDYARNGGRAFPTASAPAYVYEFDIPTDPPPAGMVVIDPVSNIAARNSNPLASPSYHHDGNMSFLLGVVDPSGMAMHLNAPIRTPMGSSPTPRSANLSPELETLVRALRDAEVLALGVIRNMDVAIIRHDVY